ncbi:MAG: hypothetical protein BHV62_07990 [Eggerthella sp. 51_9]|nr:MAG: hypothetical protein BHV62_07990 [Eggerthella sp. 51_9]
MLPLSTTIGYPRLAEGTRLALRLRLHLGDDAEEIFDARKEFPLLVRILIGVVAQIACNTMCVDAETARIVHSTIQMVLLRNDNAALHVEYILQAVHAVVCGKARMITENIFGGNPVGLCVLRHGHDLVV